MRNLIFMVLIGLLCSCANDDDTNVTGEIIGRWRLIEQLLDPGDGSGVFRPVESDFIIEFLPDGTYKANRLICNIPNDPGGISTGTYDTEDMLISTENCSDNQGGTFTLQRPYRFDGNSLIIELPCIEPCAEKFQKLE